MPRLGLPLVLLLGACVRGFLYALPSVHSTLSSRPELVTSVSSFRRLQEGAYLFRSTGSPYSGTCIISRRCCSPCCTPFYSSPQPLYSTW